MAAYSKGAAFGSRISGGNPLALRNCVFFFPESQGSNLFGPENANTSNNATTDAGPLAIGPNSIHNLTVDQAKTAHDFLAGNPSDWRQLDVAGSLLQDAGIAVAGVTLDYNGNARDGTNPNIGPAEGLTLFGVAGAGRQVRARYHNV